MSIPLVANILVTLDNEEDKIFFEWCLKSIVGIVDEIIILNTGKNLLEVAEIVPRILERSTSKYQIKHNSSIIKEHGFAAARNLMLQASPENCYILYRDSDEVGFPEELKLLKETILNTDRYDDISTYFIHLCLGFNGYERFEQRTTIFRKTPETKWVNKVHEKITHGLTTRSIFYSDYTIFHFGYVRSQEYVFNRWHQYAILEGQTNPYKDEEVNGTVVPYFREGREGPDKILEDRKKTLMPYFGKFPNFVDKKYIESKQVVL